MKYNIYSLLLILFISNLTPKHSYSQDDLMDLFESDEPSTEYSYATFKTTRISLGQSVENPANGNLIFDIQHHFGRLNTGAYEFFGLDQSNTRLGFQYGITDWLTIGLGRASFEKLYDGSLKIKVVRQSKGKVNMPFSISYFGDMGINTLKWQDTARTNYFSSRLTYTNQILIARKFSSSVSIQLTPTYIHRNFVETSKDDNDVWALGVGGRVKLSKRISLNLEYYYIISQETAKNYDNSLTLGFDIETGGHVFQLFFSNSRGITEQQFIPETTGNWLNGDIHFGFNISRTFVLKKPKEFREKN